MSERAAEALGARGVTVHTDSWVRLYEPRRTEGSGPGYYSREYIELRLVENGDVLMTIPRDSDMRRGRFNIADIRKALDILENC